MRRLLSRFGIQHGKKVRQQVAFGILGGKVVLMVPHHGDQDFFRKLKKVLFEAAHQHGRPLRKMGRLVD